MICSACQSDNPPDNRFCGQCGQPLARRCAGCGTEAPDGARFCGQCGLPLEGTANPPPTDLAAMPEAVSPRPTSGTAEDHGERKQVTVLSVAPVVTGADDADPETRHAALSGFLQAARQEVERYQGTVHQLGGSRLVALFGAPVAHEDHARRAVLAAVGLRDALAGGGAPGVDLRAGLGSGTVVVGGVDGLVVGDAPQRAQELQRLAGPGAIWLAEATARQVRPFVDLEEPGSRGPGEPSVPPGTLQVVRLRHGELPVDLERDRPRSPFVGRQRELDALAELAATASAGEGQVVGITGAAGSGKTRLVFELGRRLAGTEPVVHLRGRCLSYGEGVPYLPIVHMVRLASHLGPEETAASARDKLLASLETIGTEPQAVLPYLLRLLGFAEAGLGGGEGADELDRLGAPALQARTFAALRRMVLDASRERLVVVELEDLQWIDATSEAFLDSLVESIGSARVLVLTTYRSGTRPGWLQKSYSSQITMRRLSMEDRHTLVRSALGDRSPSADVLDDIVEKADGNPFFLEEMARALAEQGEAVARAVPETVQGLLMARIDRLPGAQKRLLQKASVLGREFSHPLLAPLWSRDEPGEPLEPLLDDLRRREFIDQSPGREQSTFKHALTQEVAYGSLLAARRRELHARAVAVLEELHADHLEEVYDQLAFHGRRTGDASLAIRYLTLFAQRVTRDYAHAEAANALSEALEQARRLDSGDLRDRTVVEVLLQLAESLFPLARFRETLELLERHRPELGRVDDPALTAGFLFWLAHTRSYLGEQEAAREAALAAIEAATEAGDEAVEGRARYVLGRDGFWTGDLAQGLEESLRAAVLLERTGEVWWQGQAHWVAGFHLLLLGRFERGFEEMARAATIGEALEDYRLDPSWSVGYFHAVLGEGERGLEECRLGLERAQDPLNRAAALGFLGRAQLETGDARAATEALEEAVAGTAEAGVGHLQGWFLAFAAEASLQLGRRQRAREQGEEALALSRQVGFPYGEALAARKLGRLELVSGHLDAAQDLLESALRGFERLSAAFDVARTRLDLAGLHHARGDEAAATAARAAARRDFDQLGVDRYAQIAEREDLAVVSAVSPSDL
jgi:class 3 adenylate cyclase/tetratricopeptide (TPR) repeat protein